MQNTKPSDSDIYSQALGEKLLQGWAMLDLACPKCPSIPLMKPRNGDELFCVACNSFQHEISHMSEPPPTTSECRNGDSIEADALRKLRLSISSSIEYDTSQFLIKGSNTEFLSLVEQKLRILQLVKTLLP